MSYQQILHQISEKADLIRQIVDNGAWDTGWADRKATRKLLLKEVDELTKMIDTMDIQ